MSSLETLLNEIEEALKERVAEAGLDIPLLEEAIAYSLLKGGRRIRPLLTLIIAGNLPYRDAAIPAALATEYFHTASLVADDLPCMDDAKTRRDHPATHLLYGEGNAILVTYALISQGFQLLGESGAALPETKDKAERLQEAFFLAARSTGLNGATGGQYLDLNAPPKTVSELLDLLKRKTAALFGMAFGMGWIFGGGDLKKLPEVEDAAFQFGLAFQLNDDLLDEESDKLQAKGCNLCLHLGRDKVRELLDETLQKFREAIHFLGIETPLFEELTLEAIAKTH